VSLIYRVVFSPEAEAQLISIYEYIAGEASPETASRFTSAIADYCEGLSRLPHLGLKRDDLRPGMRIIGFRRRVSIAVVISGYRVDIVGIFYGGQDLETLLTRDL
jgi:toxin ParE1/3/4